MTTTRTDIANMAISHIGYGKEIGDLDLENSEEASVCRRFYDTARSSTLRDFPWPFAMITVGLNLIEESPNSEWDYSYRYPNDCLYIRRILSGNKRESRDDKVAYKIGKDESGLIIYTDYANAEIEYTQDITDPNFFTAEFSFALSLRLGSYISSRLTKGDPFSLRKSIMEFYSMEIENVKTNALNEEQSVREPESEFIRGRN